MTVFPEWFFNALILAALILTGLSAAGLLSLLFRDWKKGRLW
ncbi:MAG TPA: hypothetical protein VD788_10935 [Candidatus Polarisedimenticolaceae bacterium]|nr:hypothetical protein [Candidatus Polarisedimenticolaceae bacterium]